MPKIIEGVREKILSTVRELILEKENITIDRIAKAVGIANGTVFNYFPSKEMIIASVILEDWIPIFQTEFEVGEKGLDGFYSRLQAFCEKYRHVWEEAGTMKGVQSEIKERHSSLRDQVEGVLKRILPDLDEKLYPLHAEMVLLLARDPSLSYSTWKKLIF